MRGWGWDVNRVVVIALNLGLIMSYCECITLSDDLEIVAILYTAPIM